MYGYFQYVEIFSTTADLNTNKAATQSPRLPYEITQFCELLIQEQLNQLDELLSVTNS